MIRILLLICIATSQACMTCCEKESSGPGGNPETELDSTIDFTRFNYFAGAQTIGYKYGFTADQGLVETARRIREMGSNIIKFAVDEGEKNPGLSGSANTLVEWISNVQEFKTVLEMDFKYYFMWAYGPSSFGDGMTQAEKEEEYQAIYDMAEYLLTEYNNTGKKFYIGNWEGDWHLYADFNLNNPPSQTTIDGMRDWFNIRQKAVDDAKAQIAHQDVEVYHYVELNQPVIVELNQPVIGMNDQPCIARDILPDLSVDYVSYSTYDVIYKHFNDTAALRTALHEVLDYLEQQLPAKPGVEGKRIFIGEYGYALAYCGGEQTQKILSKGFMRSAISWGCPFVLYWAFYCNELQDDGSYNGFWMINDNDVKQPVYFMHEEYYHDLKLRIQKYLKQNDSYPDSETIRQFALELL